ncbi:MAG: ParB/RepB/Spo0J family partition protein [Saprospiraceae bacterium]|nr:ParB/RepB/Spo0J family partition protein [Saprospiraceae bacterium]
MTTATKKLNKNDFGKGIRALLANPVQLEQAVHDNPQEVVRELATAVAMLPLDQIQASLDQPRKKFDDVALRELADSIKVHGIIQPLTVRRLGPDTYQIISGERRFRASKIAGLTEVPAYVRLANDQEMLEMALIENIQREDLNPIEVATSYQRLIEEFELTHENLSERVGKERSTITNYLRVLHLPVDVKEALQQREISLGHAKALAGVDDDRAFQLSALAQIRRDGLSVRAVEELVKKYHESKGVKKAKADTRLPEPLRQIQDQFSAFFGAKATLKRDTKGKGQITLKFNNDTELNRLLDAIDR